MRAQEFREERKSKRTYWNLLFKGVFSVGKVIISNLDELQRLRKPGSVERRYIRPPRRYTLPAYQEDMRYCRSRTRYLRPTRCCNSHAPDVIALAHELGAYQMTDREFAQAAFNFVKEKTTLEIHPIVGVEETLRRGTGTCFQLISVFIALCRAVGIKARYKIFATEMIPAWQESTIEADPLLKKWYDALGYFLLEGEGEAYVDGSWEVAHVGPTAERQAAGGIPITHFGEDALGVWFQARPGTIMRLEALPMGLAAGSWLLHKISPASMERVNASVLQKIEEGRKIIQDAGGAQAYDRKVRNT